jgi:hypothetical protein
VREVRYSVIMITRTTEKDVRAALEPLLPAGWFDGPPALTVDADEILIVGALAAGAPGAPDAGTFREATREQRVGVARQLESAFGRHVAWGVTAGGATTLFTGLGVPVMTRLRAPERQVLDTLAAAGVARSRSDAVAWCVRFVSQREGEWLSELRSSLERVGEVRSGGPSVA